MFGEYLECFTAVGQLSAFSYAHHHSKHQSKTPSSAGCPCQEQLLLFKCPVPAARLAGVLAQLPLKVLGDFPSTPPQHTLPQHPAVGSFGALTKPVLVLQELNVTIPAAGRGKGCPRGFPLVCQGWK